MPEIPNQPTPSAPPAETLPAQLPVLPMSDVVVFPNMIAPLVVSSASSIRLIDDVVGSHRLLGLVLQRQPGIENPKPADLYEHGCAGRVLKMLKFPDDSVREIG